MEDARLTREVLPPRPARLSDVQMRGRLTFLTLVSLSLSAVMHVALLLLGYAS